MSNINWNHPKLRKITPEKKQILMELESDISTLPSDNSFPYLVATMSKLKKKGIQFTEEEMCIIQHFLTQNMSEKDKQKFVLLKNLLKKS